jgi:hypothetical protein
VIALAFSIYFCRKGLQFCGDRKNEVPMARARGGRKKKGSKRLKTGHVRKKGAKAKRAFTAANPSAGQLEKVSREFDAAVDNLRTNLGVVGECLYELLAAEAARESRRQFASLAEAGVLHCLQTLAAAMDSVPQEALPPSLEGVERYATRAVSEIARTFNVQAIHQPGEVITVAEEAQMAFDWAADTISDRTFPFRATVLRSGWRCDSEVLVRPKLTRAES